MPEALRHSMLTASAEKPLVLQVGSHMMYAEGHIPGSEYVGKVRNRPGSSNCRIG
jgi:hypothetical protein